MSNPQIGLDDPEATRSSAADAKSLSEELEAKVKAALSRIEEIESSEPWGNDEPGQAFANGKGGNGYVSASTGYREVAPKVGPAAAGLFTAVTSTVDVFTDVDDQGKTTIDGSVDTGRRRRA